MSDFVNGPRANQPVSAGPSGLVSWCVVAASPQGWFAKPAGTIAFSFDGTNAWWNADGTDSGWIALGNIAGSVPRIVLDVDYAAVDHVDLPTLDPTKRYRFILRNNDGTGAEVAATLIPQGASGGAYLRRSSSPLTACGLQIARGVATLGPAGTGVLEPVSKGRHDFIAFGCPQNSGVTAAQMACFGGADTITSYAGWTVAFTNAAGGAPFVTSGHLRVVEESGGVLP